MPYKDKAKRDEAIRKSKEKAQRLKEQETQAGLPDLGDVPLTMELVEAISLIQDDDEREAQEAAIKRKCKSTKAATWGFIFYPDSAPPDWEDILRMSGHIVAVSPLHDQDMKKDGSGLKKPHYHGIITKYNGGTYTFRTACQVSQGLLHGTIPIQLESPRGYYRYLCHLDNPDKARYNESEIIRINGFDPGAFMDMTREEKAKLRGELTQMVYEMGFQEFGDLCMYAFTCLPIAEYDFISTQTIYFKEIIKSAWRSGRQRKYYGTTAGGNGAEPGEAVKEQAPEGGETP